MAMLSIAEITKRILLGTFVPQDLERSLSETEKDDVLAAYLLYITTNPIMPTVSGYAPEVITVDPSQLFFNDHIEFATVENVGGVHHNIIHVWASPFTGNSHIIAMIGNGEFLPAVIPTHIVYNSKIRADLTDPAVAAAAVSTLSTTPIINEKRVDAVTNGAFNEAVWVSRETVMPR